MKNVVLTSIDLNELVQLLVSHIEEVISKRQEVIVKQVVVDEPWDKHLTKKQVAEICKVSSLTTLWNWEQSGKLVPRRKAGKSPLYLREDVEAFLKGDSQSNTSKED